MVFGCGLPLRLEVIAIAPKSPAYQRRANSWGFERRSEALVEGDSVGCGCCREERGSSDRSGTRRRPSVDAQDRCPPRGRRAGRLCAPAYLPRECSRPPEYGGRSLLDHEGLGRVPRYERSIHAGGRQSLAVAKIEPDLDARHDLMERAPLEVEDQSLGLVVHPFADLVEDTAHRAGDHVEHRGV